MAESHYQKKLQDALRERGAWIVKYPAGPHGVIGTPDLLCCYLGWFVAIECKAGNPKLKRYQLTPMQQRQRQEILNAEGSHLVAWPGNHQDVMRFFDGLDVLETARL